MKTLGLISCTKKKLDRKCKASEMYSTSDLFRKAYDYCKKNYDGVAILSAKYGLVLPFDEIEPYNVTLKNMCVPEVKKWSSQVYRQFLTKIDTRDLIKVYFHAGKSYRQYLIPMLEMRGIKCEAPLKDLAIGEQLAWYKEHLCGEKNWK